MGDLWRQPIGPVVVPNQEILRATERDVALRIEDWARIWRRCPQWFPMQALFQKEVRYRSIGTVHLSSPMDVTNKVGWLSLQDGEVVSRCKSLSERPHEYNYDKLYRLWPSLHPT